MSEKVNNEKVNETAKAVSLEAAEEVKTPKVEAAPAAEKKEVVEEELATATVASPVAEKEATTVEEVVEEKKSRLPTAADLLADDVVEPIKRKKGSKNVPVGIAFVKTTFNNTIVSITDMRGMLFLGVVRDGVILKDRGKARRLRQQRLRRMRLVRRLVMECRK